MSMLFKDGNDRGFSKEILASDLQSATSLDKECGDLVELITESIRQEELEKVIDPKLKDKYNKEQLERMVEVALLCIKDDRNSRPA
ncbi:hypothetical protein CRYUN_Cryun09bG0016300 [Craigia yunnanensis]